MKSAIKERKNKKRVALVQQRGVEKAKREERSTVTRTTATTKKNADAKTIKKDTAKYLSRCGRLRAWRGRLSTRT